MKFTVPKFIEREPKIIGPFTLKQFIFIGLAGTICFIVFFTLPFYYFVLVAVILIPGAFGLAFLRIQGYSLPVVLANFLKFSVTQKLYLWQRKEYLPKFIVREEEPEKEEIKEKVLLEIAEKSRLKKIRGGIETGIK